MRVTGSMMYRDFITSLDTLNSRLDTVNQQLSTGKKYVHLRDGPSVAAENVLLKSQADDLDQYEANNNTCSYYLQVADSALNAVQNLVTTIQEKGSAAASGTLNASNLASVAAEIRSQREQIFSLANSTARGRYVFSGSKVSTPAFALSGDAATYQGDDTVSYSTVDDGLQIQQNVVGSTGFSPIFDSIQSLAAAIDGGDHASIEQALTQFTASLDGLSQIRSRIGFELNKAQNATAQNNTEKLNLQTRQSQLEDANTAEVASQLSQIESALDATLAAGSQSILQRQNLFDFLG